MRREPGAAPKLPRSSEASYRIHSRIRILALLVTISLVFIEIPLARRIPEQPYSGAVMKGLSVARVARDSPAARSGLKKGDTVLSINGVQCSSLKDVSECISLVRPGETIAYEVNRGGMILTMPMTFGRLPLSEILRKASLLIVGFSFVAIGLLVYFRRTDKLTLIFYLLCFAFGLILINLVTYEVGIARQVHRSIFNDLIVVSLPALFLHFFLLFPEKSKIIERFRRLESWIYVPMAVLFATSAFFSIMVFSYGRSYAKPLTAFQSLTAAYFIAFVVIGLIAFLRSYRRVTAGVVKRKLRLVVWGTIVGTLPLVTVHVVLSIQPAVEIPGEKIAFLPLILVPMAFGHAIIKYGLMDLEIVFKRSLVYTLLIAVLASVYFAVVYGIGRLASRFIGSADLLFSIISIFVITLLISPLRARIRSIVDKTFFRQEYNYRKVLKQISHSLAGIIELDGLVSYLCIRIAEVLDASTAVVFLLDERTGRYRAQYAVNAKHPMLKGFEQSGIMSTHLRTSQATLNLERRLESMKAPPVADDELEQLLSIRAALVVPFIIKSNLLGFICIGRKGSDEFYSITDVELLETLGDQVALAIENARLYLETIEKQKMEKDLEVAKEIQHRLLPKSLPDVPGIRTHAVNIPSKHVGGDYFDLIPLTEGEVAVVIADVSGKGVPAALLMASLQSSLRSEASSGRAPSSVISTLNKAIYEHTAGDKFVTIFYGLIDFAARSLTYCNAGQTPPVILHDDETADLLDETDIVIGIDSNAQYRNTSVGLRRGDLFFLYTDGITDELDDRDEPFGERRLLEHLRRSRQADLPTLMKQVHDAVIEHTGGKPQDDITAMAICIDSLDAFLMRNGESKKSLNIPLGGADP
jgi:sigma-B regulation protein RsbU (phosphoserine phosphatase)